jgi:ribosomal protein L37AE/L43A
LLAIFILHPKNQSLSFFQVLKNQVVRNLTIEIPIRAITETISWCPKKLKGGSKMKKTNWKKTKNPVRQYAQCPACKCKNLIRLEVDVICAECDWMSAEAYVESGGMDNLFGAYLDHFNLHGMGEVETAPPPVECELDLDESA